MIHSRLLGRDFETEEEKQAAEEAFKARMKSASPAEQNIQKGVNNASQSGMFNRLRSFIGSK